jgi:putative radical SAM enzyme (TIGR03279 family)
LFLLWRVVRIVICNDKKYPKVHAVRKDSLADRAGIRQGDRIVSINGSALRDLIDYKYLISDDLLKIVIRRGQQEWVQIIEKDPDTDLGIDFEDVVFDGIRKCKNKCIFCFIDQLPKGMRSSLYIKDDDYRLSVLCGNFITLTNLNSEDFKRITQLHLGPLYISVHTTDPILRATMVGNPEAAKIREHLEKLAHARITMHIQIVLCPDLNDKEHLDKTISDLSQLWPYVSSIGIVPVGLTHFRKGLFSLRHFTKVEAMNLIQQIEKWQEHFLKVHEYPLVFLADEFYFLANVEVPSTEAYWDFPQLENGIGITRLFFDELEDVQKHLPKSLDKKLSVTLVAGVLGEFAGTCLVSVLNGVKNLRANLVVVRNLTFGDNITATGLVTGASILERLRNEKEKLGDLIVIPRVMLKYDEDVFLDDITVRDLEQDLCRKVMVVDGSRDLVHRLVSEERSLI